MESFQEINHHKSKMQLKRALHSPEQVLEDEGLQTALCQVEAILNDWAITIVSDGIIRQPWCQISRYSSKAFCHLDGLSNKTHTQEWYGDKSGVSSLFRKRWEQRKTEEEMDGREEPETSWHSPDREWYNTWSFLAHGIDWENRVLKWWLWHYFILIREDLWNK